MPQSAYDNSTIKRPITEEVNLPAFDHTAGTACVICPSRDMRQAIYDHDRGFMSKLADCLLGYVQKLRGK